MKSKLLKWLSVSFCAGLAVVGLAACEKGDGGNGGDVDPADLNGGKALNYVLLEDDTYGVTVGECYTVPEITIPAKYEGKTVSTVLYDFFEGAKDQDGNDVEIEEKDVVTYSIILSEGITTLEPGAFRNVYSLKRLELAKSVVNFGTSDEAWQKGHPCGLVEIYNKGNLPLTDEEAMGEYGWIAREAENVYTPESGERKMTMDANGVVTFVDTEGKKALVDYCGTNSVLNVPADVEYIYQNACRAVGGLKEVTIPANCKTVEDYAFNACPDLEVINISEGVQKIEYAFMYLENFIYANIPQSVTTLDSYAFNDRAWRGVVCYYGNEDDYNKKQHSRDTLFGVKKVHRTADGYAYAEREADVVLLKYFGNASDVTIADTYESKPVTMVYNLAFYANEHIEKLVVGNNVTKIGKEAFSDCHNLFEAVLSDSVQGVAEYGFYNCINLTKLTVGANVSNTYYTSGMAAFSGCYRLVEVYNRSTYDSALNGISSSVAPENIYTEANGSKLTEENGFVLYTDGDDCWVVNYIGDETEIVIPDKVTEIRKNALANKAITKVTIGNGVTKINDGAFTECRQLTDVTIGTGVTYIGGSAFNCKNLMEIRYLGTKNDWSNVDKYSGGWNGWKHELFEKVVCSDGEITY